jgi:LPXTG-site transpeptidase (sortase) family protein
MEEPLLSEEDIKKLFMSPSAPSRPSTPAISSKETPPPDQSASPQESARLTIISPAASRYHSRSRRLGLSWVIFLATFLVSFILLNIGTFGDRLSFWWRTDIRGQQEDTSIIFAPASNSTTNANQPSGFSAQPTPTIIATPKPSSPSASSLTPNQLVIPKIRVEAPVIWKVSPDRILSELRRGVAHYQGTATPNDSGGNVFITGHSSGFFWDRGAYNRVFANLDKLVAGDLIALSTDSARYIYKVKDSIVVRPNQVEVLNQTATPSLSLMTCVPVGTNLRRLVVRADLFRVMPLE